MQAFAFLSAAAALFAPAVSAQKYVFAHQIVGNTASHTVDTWTNDIQLAAATGLDAFALNMGYPDSNIAGQVANAFQAAEAIGGNFKLFFSFDYLGGGSPWPASEVVSYLQQYASSSSYFHYQNVPFVSTFEGTANINDWAPGGAIRGGFGEVFFVPDYTSLGPGGIGNYLGDIDGFFSWDMWPTGATDKTDDTDLAWQSAIAPKPYMMGVSPWFFHSSPTYPPDWVWRGDDLWAERWNQVLAVQPEFVEIVTWNDFGESHYIGPIHSDADIAPGSSVFVDNMPHDSFRDFLPYYIATFKGDNFDISRDQMQYWYRLAPGAGGSACGVTGNDPDYQATVDPNSIVQDKVFFSALLTSAGTVEVSIGGNAAVSYQGVAGINHWSQPFNGQTGAVTFTLVRNGATVKSGTGAAITASTSESNGCTNYNTWAGSW